MKKFLTTGVLALALAAIATQESNAWVNSKFGIGLNWNYQSGGNNLLWGAFRNGQPPAPDCGVCPGGMPGGVYPGAPAHGYMAPGADQGFTGHLDAAPSSATSAVPARTQSYNNRMYYNSQTVNYQYPYPYGYYNNYNYYYGYGR